ncbi:TonB-dependent receptor [Corallococcus llansteffanensis]|uniref:TonB-dependent receptor n=1 Tax=Corallococcus llansteffanensis TaxID=2316731 RepID=A0A3A8PE51_9BACT|nr:TonB-dependent receptor [Corallococcus llansteffanensis]RKH54623.1 TonB-dependent receptor [Corallococcus llansteffanensis]
MTKARQLMRGGALVLTWACATALAQETPPAEQAAPPVRETVVQGVTRAPDRPREDEAASASTITENRTPRSGESVPQLLSELPGVSVTQLGGLGSQASISIRGSTPSQVSVYVDGVPLNSMTGGGVDLGALPLGDVERIEVYRGMSPIGFGESGLGGVVSITTRVPTEDTLSLDVGGGSFGTWSAGAAGSAVMKPVRLYGGVHVMGARGDFGYFSDNGTAFDPSDDRNVQRQNNDFRQVDGLVRGVLTLSRRREVRASLSLFARNQGVPGLGIYDTRESDLSTLRLLGSASYESREDLGPGGRLRAQFYTLLTEQRFRDPLGEVAPIPTSSRDTTTTLGSTLRASQPFGPRLRFTGLLDGRYESSKPRDLLEGRASGTPSSRLFGAAGIEANVWFPSLKLDVMPSARLEVARDVVSGRDPFGQPVPEQPPITRTFPVLRLALIARPSEQLAMRANLGRYARLPSSTELYGNTGFLLGNPKLQPESGFNADLGTTLARPLGPLHVNLDAAVFGALVDDLIQFQQNAQGQARAINIGQARILGTELSVSVSAYRHLSLRAQGTFTDALDTSNVAASRDRQLPLRPRFQTYSRLELEKLPLGRFRVGAYVDGHFTGGNYLDPANLVRVSSRLLFGAGGSISFEPQRLRLVLSAQNLGNSRVNDLVGFPLPGRAFFATLSWSPPLHSQSKAERDASSNEEALVPSVS